MVMHNFEFESPGLLPFFTQTMAPSFDSSLRKQTNTPQYCTHTGTSHPPPPHENSNSKYPQTRGD